jgi:hypothetical protein
MDLLSGNMRLDCRSQSRRGARRHGRASCNSLEAHAETDAARFAVADESAPTSAAHAARCEADAVLADSTAQDAARAPQSKNSRTKQPTSQPLDKDAPNGEIVTGETCTKPASTGSGSGGEPPKDFVKALCEERFYLDGGDPLPADRPRFVDAVNAHIDLVRATELMLRGQDEKSTKSLLELLLEMKYGVKHAGNAKPQSPLDRLPAVLRD